MDMSRAAIAPRHAPISGTDRAHPRFPEYQRYRASCSINMIECESFKDWNAATLHREQLDRWSKHPRFPEFQEWMRVNKAGGRKCPRGSSFPDNFIFWLSGGVW